MTEDRDDQTEVMLTEKQWICPTEDSSLEHSDAACTVSSPTNRMWPRADQGCVEKRIGPSISLAPNHEVDDNARLADGSVTKEGHRSARIRISGSHMSCYTRPTIQPDGLHSCVVCLGISLSVETRASASRVVRRIHPSTSSTLEQPAEARPRVASETYDGENTEQGKRSKASRTMKHDYS
jgi:hypothetical protein